LTAEADRIISDNILHVPERSIIVLIGEPNGEV